MAKYSKNQGKRFPTMHAGMQSKELLGKNSGKKNSALHTKYAKDGSCKNQSGKYSKSFFASLFISAAQKSLNFFSKFWIALPVCLD